MYAFNPDAFDVRLPLEIEKIKRERALQRISGYNDDLEDRRVAEKAISRSGLSTDEKEEMRYQVNQPGSPFGRFLAAGIAGIAAPLLVSNYLYDKGNSAISKALTALSIPIGAYGGMSLYDIVNAPKFIPIYPEKNNGYFR